MHNLPKPLLQRYTLRLFRNTYDVADVQERYHVVDHHAGRPCETRWARELVTTKVYY